jgi:hypothetical protein
VEARKNVHVDWHVDSNVLNGTWSAIKGMVRGHPDLIEFQDPMLMAVFRAEIFLSSTMSAQEVYENVGRKWDGFADARFLCRGVLRLCWKGLLESKWTRKKKRWRHRRGQMGLGRNSSG